MENRHFTLIVAGNNPNEILAKYDSTNKVVPYVLYKFSNAKKLHTLETELYTKLVNSPDFENADSRVQENILSRLEELKAQDDIEFFLDLAEGYEMDEKTGDIITCNNPYGKYDACDIGGKYALPLKTKDGNEVYAALKKDIDWDEIHLANQAPYKIAWDTVMGGKKPKTEDEKTIYENMKNRKAYFELFGDKGTYVAHSTAFWGFAFLSEETGWVELQNDEPQFDWTINFFDRFIKPLSADTKISVYECYRA